MSQLIAALRTASASARTLACTAGTNSAEALPSLSRFRPTRSTSAEPTTAASAMRAISAACSGSRMPKPTATGSRVCRLMRATSGATSSATAAFWPVMPVTET